ncbi:MAG: GAF domain-containing protein [Chitinophagaceae bacterium]|nr:MAG: GAF domain-containing protein [Chitinophagaceae bacterium]
MDQLKHKTYDSEFCGNLPIHLINVIQSYGALAVLEKNTLNIIQVSINIDTVMHLSADHVVNKPFSMFLGAGQLELFNEKASARSKDKTPFLLSIKGREYWVLLHETADYHLLEINFHQDGTGSNSFVDVYQSLKGAIAAIEKCETIQDAAVITARELKKASGFDKVMIYRFDENWNGNVLAEEREPDMESYLNFTFPASDIPKPARDLYYKNSYRFIPDCNYKPVKLYPVINPQTQAFIDLSDCNIRGVSAVHIEYLKNMKVTASMSTRILSDDKLWGLIACHHKTPKPMSFKICVIFELLSGIISSKINALTRNEKLILNNRLKDVYSAIVEHIFRTRDLSGPVLSDSPEILKLFSAGGAVIAHRGEKISIGNTPPPQHIEDLLLWLNAKRITSTYTTNSLAREFDGAQQYRASGSGLLAIPINSENSEFILIFRPEVIQVTDWGGDPEQRIVFEDDMKTYHPRFSFKLWREQISGVSLPWKDEELEVAAQLQSFIQDHFRSNTNNK